jgi:hypothetical protein
MSRRLPIPQSTTILRPMVMSRFQAMKGRSIRYENSLPSEAHMTHRRSIGLSPPPHPPHKTHETLGRQYAHINHTKDA